jgi:D-glycero-D-manno-heptose 1,7-bisphosphate phosphatase
VPQALRRLRAGFLLFLISNQPNYAKGKSTLEELDAIDSQFRRELAAMRVKFAAIYYCLHHPEGVVKGYSGPCACRKPSPHLLLRAMREFGIDSRKSWMLGDRSMDIECGRSAGVRTILIGANGGCGPSGADKIAADLAAATEYILESVPGRRR